MLGGGCLLSEAVLHGSLFNFLAPQTQQQRALVVTSQQDHCHGRGGAAPPPMSTPHTGATEHIMDELAEDYKEIIRQHRLGVRLFQGLLTDLLAGMELGVIDTILSPGCGQVQTALACTCPALIGRDPAAIPRYAVAADLRVCVC
jgi:hypothetical protein